MPRGGILSAPKTRQADPAVFRLTLDEYERLCCPIRLFKSRWR